MKRRITDVITKEETRNWKPGNDPNRFVRC